MISTRDLRAIARARLRDEFARVHPVPSDDPTVNFIVKNFPVEDGERRIGRNELFGLEMDDAIFLRAKLPERKKPVRKAPRATVAGTARAQR